MRKPDYRPSIVLKPNHAGIMSITKRALASAGADRDYVAEYIQKAMSSDLKNMLAVTKEYVDIKEI